MRRLRDTVNLWQSEMVEQGAFFSYLVTVISVFALAGGLIGLVIALSPFWLRVEVALAVWALVQIPSYRALVKALRARE